MMSDKLSSCAVSDSNTTETSHAGKNLPTSTKSQEEGNVSKHGKETNVECDSDHKDNKETPALWKSHYQQQQDQASAMSGNAASRENAPIDWHESRLPELFGCVNTAMPPPAEPMRFHSAWDLHADDHTLTNTSRFSAPAYAGGSAMTPQSAINFDPVYIATVHDVESFWRLWWCVTPPSKCPIPFTYSWFRQDIKPEWEHPRNRQGGKFTIVIFDRDRPGLNDKVALDDVFTAMVLGAVGESFAECHTTLNGVMLKLRQNKPVTLQIWTSHSEMVKLRSFAHSLREILGKIIGSKPLQKLEYFSHLQNLASYSSSSSQAARSKSKTKIAADYTF